jgi:hypothetical protein
MSYHDKSVSKELISCDFTSPALVSQESRDTSGTVHVKCMRPLSALGESRELYSRKERNKVKVTRASSEILDKQSVTLPH